MTHIRLTPDYPAIENDLGGEKAKLLKTANFLYEIEYELFANEALRKISTHRAIEDASVADVRSFADSLVTDGRVEWWDNFALTTEQREDIVRMLAWS